MTVRAKHKLTQKLIRAYCDAIAIGATLEMAAAYAGVHPWTVRQWLQTAKDAEGKEELNPTETQCIAFAEAVQQASGEAGMTWQQVVSAAANEDPGWAWKMLQVRFPKDYRQPSANLELSGAEGAALAINLVIDK